MSQTKFNIRALTIAIMFILLCLLTAVGATLALFSSTTDGKIGVNATSGSLKVDIVDASEKPETLVGEVLDFITTSSDHKVLFEPGATYYTEGFRVKNDGSIPMNFILYVSKDEELEEDFFHAFDVWITKNPTSRSDMVKLQEFGGRLEIGEMSDIYYLVFSMKTDAGNEFQNRSFTGVGITVCAVQGNVELDNDIKEDIIDTNTQE